MELIGRDREKEALQGAIDSSQAELVVLYGRRRVGKTFLVRTFLEPQAATYIEVTGTRDGNASVQRQRFRDVLAEALAAPIPRFESWEDGLAHLTEALRARARKTPKGRIVVFFDELPWLATPKSRFLESLDYYWNRHLSRLRQLTVVLCGSAASWMLRRIVHSRGGLHNRITRQLRLEPFTVAEAHRYLRSRRIRLRERETLELTMALGGVPYYLSLVERGRSVSEVVGDLCFERGAPLRDEFNRVFSSLFSNHEQHVQIVRALGSKTGGLLRDELIEALASTGGGALNRRLDELEASGFIARSRPFGNKKKRALIRIVDEYTLFYLRWIESVASRGPGRGGSRHWQSITQSPAYRAWTGYAFESLCLRHAHEIEASLGIDHLVTNVASWRHVPSARSRARAGAQVDLLFDRRDNVINLCEMKFASDPFVVTKDYARELKQKIEIFETQTRTKKRVVLTLVAPAGLKRNTWSEDLVDRVVDAKAFF